MGIIVCNFGGNWLISLLDGRLLMLIQVVWEGNIIEVNVVDIVMVMNE